MEGLIPFIVRAIKKQNLHNHSYRCLSDGSRRSYHMLGAAGDSVNGSSHRRTQSDFQLPSSLDLQQPQVDQFVRSRSVNVSNNNINNNTSSSNNNNKGLRHIQHHHNTPASAAYNYNYNYNYGDTHKFHQY